MLSERSEERARSARHGGRGRNIKVAQRGQRMRLVLTRLFRVTTGAHPTSNVTLEAAMARQRRPACVCKPRPRSSRRCAFLNST